jgi:arylsulfatase A-like enzyme
VSETPCCSSDIYPTVLAATGAKAEKQIQPLDGINLLPLIERKSGAETREKPIAFWAHAGSPDAHAALLDWPYKLHTDPVAGRGKDRKKQGKGAGEAMPKVLLYDVSKDPKETTDLAAQEPERVAKMKATLEEWKKSVEKSLAGGDYAGGLSGAGESTEAPTKKEMRKKKKADAEAK